MSITTLFTRIGDKNGQSSKKTAVIESPTLGSAKRFPYGPFQFKTRIPRGMEYEIQASTDLHNWITIATQVSTNETIEYVDGDAAKFSARFYRILVAGVVSTNAIGYAAITLPPGFSMIANPLRGEDNSIGHLFGSWPDGTMINKFDT